MNTLNLVIAVGAILFGCFTTYLRIKTPLKLKRLESLKKVFGNKVGTMIHVIAYILLPIIFGIRFIFSEIKL